MKNTLCLLAVFGVLLLAACSTVDSRIQKAAALFASYPPEVQAKIRAGQIDMGFTMEQVGMALGDSAQRSTRASEDGGRKVVREVWGYSGRGSRWSFGFGIGAGTSRGSTGSGGGVGVGAGDVCNGDNIALRVVFEEGKVVSIERLTH